MSRPIQLWNSPILMKKSKEWSSMPWTIHRQSPPFLRRRGSKGTVRKTNSHTYYENTRNQRNRTPEKNNIKNVLRHLRNSASHRRLSIHPENGRLCDGANIIKAVKFEDSRGTEKFLLKIDVKDLEQLLIEICDGIIKKTNWVLMQNQEHMFQRRGWL